MTNRAAIYIVEDHPAMQHLLRQIITRHAEMTVCGVAGTAEIALEELASLEADLVLLDVSLPGMSGIALINLLKIRSPALRCMVLSGHQENHYVQLALNAGASGYVVKDRPTELLHAIEQVLQGHIYLSPSLNSGIHEP